ncbi:MAG: hypothetical protein AAB316_11190 [Bacteroidota bacterium]
MTKDELEKRKLDLKNRLAVLTALEEMLVEQIGKQGFEAKVDEALDEIIKIEKWLKKQNPKA